MTNADAAIHDANRWLVGHTADLVDATQALIRFRTESVDLLGQDTGPPNEEAALQAWIAARLAALGAEVDQWEPDAAKLKSQMIPPWHHWKGRPMTAGRMPGIGGGRPLLINGHMDTVPAGDPDRWQHPPFAGEVDGGRIYGRGSCDMKGGMAAALLALEALADCAIRLHGDVIYAAVTDEEIGGMGTIAAAERGHVADAAVIPEPTGLNVFTATRGIIHAKLRIEGRAAHAEVNQPRWEDGGGVNANHIAVRVADALLQLGKQRRAGPAHPLLAPPSLEITGLRGGDFVATIPPAAELLINATYLPAEADASGFGAKVRSALTAAVTTACAGDGC